ncbi:hypothetical protein D7Z94_24945 [Ulvibacterium marinum]|uniref:Uncharacterized protein n=2 Tax=Ulvibacterium marinum TaxID=2419782 RepID=A0A3B0BRM1_9FLAO|nr:hypothetical protein D7Z94_24945 [Ulvibacterium marinum]
MAGEFYKKQTANKTISVSYSLNLRPDNTFVFSIKSQDANPKCEGSWELNWQSVYLKCNESDDIGEILSSGNMPDKEHKLEVINRNRIKFKNVVLTRR